MQGPDLEKIRGMWIDREYDFEKQKWNVWTLPRDSEAYKQVLADEPQLKESIMPDPHCLEKQSL